MAELTVTACALKSQHNVTKLGRSLFCYTCHSHSPPGITAAKSWLNTCCRPNNILRATYTAGTVRPSRVPDGQRIQVGHREVHSSHAVMVHKGLHFCRKCGVYAAKRLLSLAGPCNPTGKNQQETERKRKAVISLLQGNLPRGVPRFPGETNKQHYLEL